MVLRIFSLNILIFNLSLVHILLMEISYEPEKELPRDTYFMHSTQGPINIALHIMLLLRRSNSISSDWRIHLVLTFQGSCRNRIQGFICDLEVISGLTQVFLVNFFNLIAT